ncbi:hypothetical protein DPMN_156849 [Dreissena polymorpha]|uniref:Uncharacterized protein n=1 Tax=Dreissena polymorpha TaxID=45954 RepID=A0A9D4JC75_DREPO|nr:hypothetical protein DPMN_156849 [Dreissena polymorpha]
MPSFSQYRADMGMFVGVVWMRRPPSEREFVGTLPTLVVFPRKRTRQSIDCRKYEKGSSDQGSVLKGVSSTSFGDTASCRILNTTNINDSSNQLSCTAYMLRNKDNPVKCQLQLPTKHELYMSGRGTINTNCEENYMTARKGSSDQGSVLKGVSSTSFGDTASCRILNTTNINDSSNQLSCTAYMLRNKDNPVKCQLQLPTKHELYMSGRGTINTNCEENYMTARKGSSDQGSVLKGVSSTSFGDTASCRILNTTNINDSSNQLSCTAYMLRNKDNPVKCQLQLPTKHELYMSGRGTINTNCEENYMTARKGSSDQGSVLKGVSSTSFGDTASCRILNTTNINDSSNQLSCTAYMLRNKDNPVKCQLQLPTKHELYMSGRGTINTNCEENYMTARKGSSDQGSVLKGVSSTSFGDTASCRILNTTNINDSSNQLSCTAYMLRNKDNPVKCQLQLPTKHELYMSGRGTINTNCEENYMTARKGSSDQGSVLKGVSSTSFGDTASCRILNTTNINDSSNQLSCTAYMLRNKDNPVKCQLQLPTKHELYMSGRGTINTNCEENYMTARKGSSDQGSVLKGVSSTSFGDTASCRILNTTNINDSSNQLSCTAYMLRNKDNPVKCQLQLPTKHELYMSGRGTINTNCEENYMTARKGSSDQGSVLKGVSSTSFGDTASCRILNTTNINDSSNQLSCTAYMLRNKDNPVKCQLQLPTKHELYMSGRGTINTNCEENYMTARKGSSDQGSVLKGVSSTSFGDTASCRILNTTNINDSSNQLSCTAYMLRNKDNPVKCQLQLPTKHELYMSGRGTINTNCEENYMTARV